MKSMCCLAGALLAQSVKQLIALAKAKPGDLNFGSGGIGSTPHMAGELFAAMAGIKLQPRTLVDVSGRNQEITLFGNLQNMPIAIAPTGAAGLLWPEGELALARAAKEAGIPFTLATNSTYLRNIIGLRFRLRSSKLSGETGQGFWRES